LADAHEDAGGFIPLNPRGADELELLVPRWKTSATLPSARLDANAETIVSGGYANRVESR